MLGGVLLGFQVDVYCNSYSFFFANPDCGEFGECRVGSCVCPGEYTGRYCERDPCNPINACNRHGACTLSGVTHNCSCSSDTGWSGTQCEMCDPSWYGDDCEKEMAAAFAVSGATDPQYSGTYTKTAHVCHGRPVYQKGGGDGPVLYQSDYRRDWDISSSDHATSCETDNSIIYVYGGNGCAESPDGGGCAGNWVDHYHDNPQLKVVAA